MNCFSFQICFFYFLYRLSVTDKSTSRLQPKPHKNHAVSQRVESWKHCQVVPTLAKTQKVENRVSLLNNSLSCPKTSSKQIFVKILWRKQLAKSYRAFFCMILISTVLWWLWKGSSEALFWNKLNTVRSDCVLWLKNQRFCNLVFWKIQFDSDWYIIEVPFIERFMTFILISRFQLFAQNCY